MLRTAVSTVTERICHALFDAMKALAQGGLDRTLDVADKEARRARGILRELADELQWTGWKKCRGCAVDEICFVAMWPFGRVVDYYSPGCVNQSTFEADDFWSDSYWGDY